MSLGRADVPGPPGRPVKVLVADPLARAAIARLERAGLEAIERHGLKGQELERALEGCEALIVRGATRVTAEVLMSATSLKVIVRAGTGLDNIDVAAARERGIRVLNTPIANAISVAELVFGLLFALERQLVEAASALRAGRWEKSRFMGRELAGKTLGLVGFGRIGREVAARARSFEMKVLAADPLLPDWPGGFEWVGRSSLFDLLPQVDYLSLHLPLSPETRGLIGARELERMRADAVLINCARGGIVDEPVLLHALGSGALRGAALDVFAAEPPGADPLLEHPSVLATPHLGASTHEAQERAGLEAAGLVIEALARRTTSGGPVR